MQRLLFGLFLLTCAVWTYAVPALPVTISHQQPDGTVLSLTLRGDEHFSYYTTSDGIAMQRGEDGHFYPIHDMAERQTQASARREEANQQRVQRLRSRVVDPAAGPARTIGVYNNMTGTKKGLVILVNFTDVTFQAANNQQVFLDQFNQAGYSANGHIGSVKDYFSAQSYGTFTVDFDVVGPVTVSHDMAYYGAPRGADNDSYPASMVIEAVKLADTQFDVDFSLYDWNNNGEVDQVFVVYAGYNEAQGASQNTIWPHEWTLSSAQRSGDGEGKQTLDGKVINTYACASELCGTSGSTIDGIGTACHEFSHCLGYPDLYDTNGDTDGNGYGMSYYDLMASGSYNGPNGHGEVPCGYSAYERWMAGWLTPTELTSPAHICDMVPINNATTGGSIVSNNEALVAAPSRAYLIKNGSDDNYFLLENRMATDFFQYYRHVSPSSGLFITHVQYDATAWKNNKVNAVADNQRLIFVPADGVYSHATRSTDFFPTTSVISFTEAADKPVTNIAKSADGRISFDFMGGMPDANDPANPAYLGAGLYFPHVASISKGANSFVAPVITTLSEGEISYTSSNTAVAEVNASTGAVTLKAVGTTIITVTQAASGNYQSATSSYMLQVVK